MNKIVLNFLSIVCLFSLVNVATSATYYIRTDGGDSERCNGTVDAPDSGSGTDQPCAWSHPFEALDSDGNWKIQGGDTLLIYFSEDGVTYQEEDLIKRVSLSKIKAGRSKVLKLSYSFPVGQSTSGRYIIAVIDKDDLVKEIDEGNNFIVFGPI